MAVRASAFCLPVGVTIVGWAWVALGYRLAFHGALPEDAFYHRLQGPNLERWLCDAPMLFVLACLAILALVVCRAWLRERRSALAMLFFLECLACAIAFAAPVIWFIDLPGAGGIFI